MELNDQVKWEEIHKKFKNLVKKYHPDKNQGNKEFEDRLKKITLAYSQLKKNDQILEVVLEGTTIKILLKKHNHKYIGKFKEMEFVSTGN